MMAEKFDRDFSCLKGYYRAYCLVYLNYINETLTDSKMVSRAVVGRM